MIFKSTLTRLLIKARRFGTREAAAQELSRRYVGGRPQPVTAQRSPLDELYSTLNETALIARSTQAAVLHATDKIGPTLGDRLAALRAVYGKTQAEFAAHLQIGRATLQSFEQRSLPPKGRTLNLLAHDGVDINWLLTGEGYMFRDLTLSRFGYSEPARPKR